MSNIKTINIISRIHFAGEDELWTNKAIRPMGWKIQQNAPQWRPPTDVFETEDAFVVVVEVAGMRGTEIAVMFENKVLTVRGNRYEKADFKAFHQMEIAHGEFETVVRLPKSIKIKASEAVYSDGFLRITLPKAKIKRIPIEE